MSLWPVGKTQSRKGLWSGEKKREAVSAPPPREVRAVVRMVSGSQGWSSQITWSPSPVQASSHGSSSSPLPTLQGAPRSAQEQLALVSGATPTPFCAFSGTRDRAMGGSQVGRA